MHDVNSNVCKCSLLKDIIEAHVAWVWNKRKLTNINETNIKISKFFSICYRIYLYVLCTIIVTRYAALH